MRVTVHAEECLQELDRITFEFAEYLKYAVGEAADKVESEAKNRCPGDGDDSPLRASIQHQWMQEGEHPIAMVYTDSEYAPYVHEGTGLYSRNGHGRDGSDPDRPNPWRYQDDKGDWHITSGNHPQPFFEEAYLATKSDIPVIIQEKMEEKLRGG